MLVTIYDGKPVKRIRDMEIGEVGFARDFWNTDKLPCGNDPIYGEPIPGIDSSWIKVTRVDEEHLSVEPARPHEVLLIEVSRSAFDKSVSERLKQGYSLYEYDAKPNSDGGFVFFAVLREYAQ